MSEAAFRLIYDGEAVRDGEMDVSDLAPALMGVAQLLKASGRVLYGDEAKVSVRVRTMKDGSFDVHLSALVVDARAFWAWLKTSDGQAASSLLSMLGLTASGGIAGAIGIVRALKGRRPRVRGTEQGFVALEVDGVEMIVPEAQARMALDTAVRVALEKVVADPLEREGIDSVSFGGATADDVIRKEEAQSFRALTESAEDEFTSRYVRAFSIQSLSFKPDRKWRLSDGHGSAKLVTIHDLDFEGRVQRNEVRFAKGDILICDVVERSWRTATGFKSEYEITRVIEHRLAPAQEAFDLTFPEEGGPLDLRRD